MGRGIPFAAMGRPLRRSGHPMRHNNPTGVEEAPAPEPEAAPEPEEASFSMSNTKAELLTEADRLGLGVTSGNTKAEILAAIEAA